MFNKYVFNNYNSVRKICTKTSVRNNNKHNFYMNLVIISSQCSTYINASSIPVYCSVWLCWVSVRPWSWGLWTPTSCLPSSSVRSASTISHHQSNNASRYKYNYNKLNNLQTSHILPKIDGVKEYI